jgi:hypothetical protein
LDFIWSRLVGFWKGDQWFFFHKIATPPYPLGNDTGRSGSFISTLFATNVQLKYIPIGSIQTGICAKLESVRYYQTGLFY